jgi:MraZ protein
VAEAFHGGYSGQGFTLRGDKGRFTLPPAFRKAVAQSSDEKILCLAKHERWTCLTGFGLSRQSELMAQVDREEANAIARGRDFDRDTRQSQLFGFIRLPFDTSGRFVMPDHLVQLGKFEDGLFFQGAGSFFTLWNPAELYKMREGWEGAQAACRMFEAETKA